MNFKEIKNNFWKTKWKDSFWNIYFYLANKFSKKKKVSSKEQIIGQKLITKKPIVNYVSCD